MKNDEQLQKDLSDYMMDNAPQERPRPFLGAALAVAFCGTFWGVLWVIV